MNRRTWLLTALLALPLGIAGVVYGNSHGQAYVCPLTGERLPCSNCCPLNEQQSYTCPLTGEELPCPKCCPLKETK
jgi:hypothetical protein